jgi:hypothetical protein
MRGTAWNWRRAVIAPQVHDNLSDKLLHMATQHLPVAGHRKLIFAELKANVRYRIESAAILSLAAAASDIQLSSAGACMTGCLHPTLTVPRDLMHD